MTSQIAVANQHVADMHLFVFLSFSWAGTDEYTTISYLSVNSQNNHPRGAMDDLMALLQAKVELTKGNKKRDADARAVRLRRKTMAGRLFKLPITSLFVVRNIKCGYSFS